MKRVFLFSLICLSVLGACDKGPNELDNFDRTLILKNIAENLIVPNYRTFLSNTELLHSATNGFIEDPKAETLTELQGVWFQARLTWKACEAFSFGPVRTNGFETAIDLFPVTTTGIEEAVANYNGADNYLVSIGNNRKGFAAIEYLLYHTTPENIIQEFEQEKRRSYLKSLAIDLERIASVILAGWEDGYYDTFISDGGNGAGASTTLLVNEFISFIEGIKNFKVAIPLGLIGAGAPLPEKVESYYAGKSLELIAGNLDLIEEIFTGKEGNGFDDYLNELNIVDDNNELLADEIVAQIEKCKIANNVINSPLQEAVIGEKTNVEQLFIELQVLTVLVKTDMMSQLGLLVTFSDNDGD